ncbi:MAG: cobalamin-dependent protein, partial [Bacteroidota bacterium]
MKPLQITFVGLGSEQLGISQLSAIARREGHHVGLAFSASLFHDRYNLDFPSFASYFDDTQNVIQDIRDQKPDVLAFSALTSTYQWMLNVARMAKLINPEIKTIFGGVHPSAVSQLDISKDEVDYVVVGEGDEAFPLILKQISQADYLTPIYNTRFKDISGNVITGVQKGFIQDLDSLPFYDKILWEEHIRLGDLYLTMASRGCPYKCTFCFNNYFANLPKEKQTVLGLYVTAKEAYEKWQAEPEKVKIIDVRTPEEFLF